MYIDTTHCFEDTATPERDERELPFQKIGTKKLRKIKEKAERKALREVCVLCFITYVAHYYCEWASYRMCQHCLTNRIPHPCYVYISMLGIQ